MDERFWDGRYLAGDRLWSGEPNGVLVAEVAGLPPGRALDAGCGEGADAYWLASRGWRVTATDISRVALERAEAAGGPDAAAVTWWHADLSVTSPEPGGYDLVSAQYFPLRRKPGHGALRGLLAAVAPGGTLLVVGHDLAGVRHDHEVDPADFYQPAEIATLLDEPWEVVADETRPRTRPAPPGSGHTHDTVLRARRRSG